MDESTIKFNQAAAAPAGGTAGNGTGTAPVRPEGARSIVDFIATSATASKLRKEGEEFVNTVVEEAKRSFGMELKVVKIAGTNYEARVLESGNHALMLIFADTFIAPAGDMAKIPVISVFPDAAQQYKLRGGQAEFIGAPIVVKEMYAKPEQCAAAYVNTFRAVDGVTLKDFSIRSFTEDCELHVSLNLSNVLAFAESTTASPISHADSGLLLYAKRRKQTTSGFVDPGKDVETIPILAVTGYTDFRRVPADAYGASYKYLATYVITNVYSLIRTEEVGLLGYAVAADVFIRRNKWLDAFMNFGPDGKNIGSLVVDEKSGKPRRCMKPEQVSAFMQTCFVSPTPLLACDLQEGCDQIPGLRALLKNPSQIIKMISDFTGGAATKQVQKIIQGEAISYDGLVETNKGKMDSRAVDYLWLIDSKNGAGINPDRAGAFLEYPDPKDQRAIERRVGLLEEIYSKVELLYKTHRAFLDPDFIDAVSADLQANIPLVIDNCFSNASYDISGFRGFAPNHGVAFTGGSMSGGFSSSGFLY